MPRLVNSRCSSSRAGARAEEEARRDLSCMIRDCFRACAPGSLWLARPYTRGRKEAVEVRELVEADRGKAASPATLAGLRAEDWEISSCCCLGGFEVFEVGESGHKYTVSRCHDFKFLMSSPELGLPRMRLLENQLPSAFTLCKP